MPHRLFPGKKLIASFALLTILALSPSLAGHAEAGCLREWQGCGQCAQDAFWEGIWNGSPGDVLDAYVDAIDCDIDLFHCVALAVHHDYACGA